MKIERMYDYNRTYQLYASDVTSTVFDQSAASLQIFFVSAGRVGRQIETSPKAIAELIGAKFEHITV